MAFRRSRPEPVVVEPTPELLPEPFGPYEGPRCFVPRDEFVENADGSFTKTLEGGWHYSTKLVSVKHRIEVQAEGEEPEVREWEQTNEVPHLKLHLNDEHEYESGWFYEYAQPEHKSWVEKRGVNTLVHLSALPKDTEHPPQAYDTHPDHLKYHEMEERAAREARANG